MHLPRQRSIIAGQGQNVPTQCINRRRDVWIARDKARSHQRLMLPSPGSVLLVTTEALYCIDQHARIAGRSQPHVHLIQLTYGHLRLDNLDHALTQTRIEHSIVDTVLAICYSAFGGIVNKH